MADQTPASVMVHDVTGWSVSQVLAFLADKGADPETATLDYEGCGSHNIELSYTMPARTRCMTTCTCHEEPPRDSGHWVDCPLGAS